MSNVVKLPSVVKMPEGWRLEVAELMLAERNAEALALIRQAIDQGDMSARVMLATMGTDAGLSRAEVDQIIAEVESEMDPNDVEAHLELRGAYDILLGNLPYEVRARKRFEHLLKAVELGAGPVNTLALATIYAMGATEVEPNPQEAIRWYKRARAGKHRCRASFAELLPLSGAQADGVARQKMRSVLR